MADRDNPWILLPRSVRELPADLAAVIVLVVLTTGVVFAPGIKETPLRIVVGLPFVLFLPGYAVIAALFPEAGESPSDDPAERGSMSSGPSRGIDGIERVALSFGLSIAIVPLIGLILNFTPWGIRLLPVLLSVSGFTIAATVVATVRRWELPAEERYSVPYEEWFAALRSELFTPETRMDAALNVLLVISVVLAVASVGYAVAIPKPGEHFTEFYLLTEDDGGDLVAADYPTEFIHSEGKSLIIGIGNQEQQRMNYTVVVELQRVEIRNNSTKVQEDRELDRFEATVAYNETWTTTYTVVPILTGDRLRLAFLLYVDEPPSAPTVDTAYRELHLWINVSNPG